MATKAQIDALIAFVLAQGESMLGLDALVEGTIEEIAAAMIMLPRAEAIAAARARGETLRDMLKNAEARRIAEIVAESLETGKTPADVMRRIREHVGLTAKDEKALEALREKLREQGLDPAAIAKQIEDTRLDKLDERAAAIAQHEVGIAIEEGNLQAATNSGATHKANVDTGEERVCPQCQDATAQGVIPIDEEYVTGVQAPPHHPGCRCSQAFFTDPSQERMDRINQAQQARLDRIANTGDAGGPGEDRG